MSLTRSGYSTNMLPEARCASLAERTLIATARRGQSMTAAVGTAAGLGYGQASSARCAERAGAGRPAGFAGRLAASGLAKRRDSLRPPFAATEACRLGLQTVGRLERARW